VKLSFEFTGVSFASDFSDRFSGVQVIFGTFTGLHEKEAEIDKKNQSWGLAVQSNGIKSEALDDLFTKAAKDLSQSCASESAVIAQSDHPHDDRWYVFGDIDMLKEAQDNDEVIIPVSEFGTGFVSYELKNYMERHGVHNE